MATKGRPKKRPEYDPDRIMKEMMDIICQIYEETGEIKKTAMEIGLSELKVRKMLVTAGMHINETCELVNDLYRKGKAPDEIAEITGLGKSSVNGYLPYMKVPYKMSEISLNAERIRVYRNRQACVERLQKEMGEEPLWDAIVAYQDYPFMTMRGLPFSYKLKIGRDGNYNKELVVNRRKESKTLAWSSVVLAFHKALEMQGEIVRRPKELGNIRGISYIYPMLYRFGIIEVPEKTADKMKAKGMNHGGNEIGEG